LKKKAPSADFREDVIEGYLSLDVIVSLFARRKSWRKNSLEKELPFYKQEKASHEGGCDWKSYFPLVQWGKRYSFLQLEIWGIFSFRRGLP